MWKIGLLNTGKIVKCLFPCAVQIPASAFLLNQKNTFPEQVYIAAPVTKPADRLFKAANASYSHVEDLEELLIEKLRLTLLIAVTLPTFGKCSGALSDLVPR